MVCSAEYYCPSSKIKTNKFLEFPTMDQAHKLRTSECFLCFLKFRRTNKVQKPSYLSLVQVTNQKSGSNFFTAVWEYRGICFIKFWSQTLTWSCLYCLMVGLRRQHQLNLLQLEMFPEEERKVIVIWRAYIFQSFILNFIYLSVSNSRACYVQIF